MNDTAATLLLALLIASPFLFFYFAYYKPLKTKYNELQLNIETGKKVNKCKRSTGNVDTSYIFGGVKNEK